MKKKIPILVALLLMAVGCVTPNAKRFIDVGPNSDRQDIHLISATDRSLRLRFSQNLAPAYLAGIEAKVIEGGLYLFPTRISSVVNKTEIDVSLVDLDLPAGWQEHIYWVDGEAIPSPLNPFMERVHDIERRILRLEK